MFEKINTKNVINNDKGDLPATTAILSNNQIGKYISKKGATILKNVFSATANGFGKAFYQPYDFTVFQDSYAFKFIDDNIDIQKIHYFITTSLNKIYLKYNWGNKSGWNKIKEEKIKLPTKDGRIDFNFMKSLISELEEERISELSAYLKVSRLDNYELSDEERKVLEDFNNIKWKEYKIKELFEVNSSKKRFDANKVDLVEQRGFPYVVRTSKNNGIKGFIDEEEKFLNPGNTISFGQDTATMWYQENQYFTGDKIKILRSNFKEFKKENSHFFITSMLKPFKVFSWGASSFSEKIIKEQEFLLPVNSKDEIDFEYMRIFIQAIKKLVIKDVVIYADEKIKATKKVVKKD